MYFKSENNCVVFYFGIVIKKKRLLVGGVGLRILSLVLFLGANGTYVLLIYKKMKELLLTSMVLTCISD